VIFLAPLLILPTIAEKSFIGHVFLLSRIDFRAKGVQKSSCVSLRLQTASVGVKAAM
jgi:hypothetical protein